MNHRIERTMFIILPILLGSALIALIPLLGDDHVQTGTFQASPRNADPAFGSIQLSTDQIFRNNTLEYNVTVAAFGTPLEMLNWSVDIQNASGNLSLLSFATKFNSPQLNNTWFVNPNSVSAGSYQVILWIKNGSDETWVTQDFEVLNNLPIINGISVEQNTVNRGQVFNVTVNATDVEIANLAPGGGADPNVYVHVHYRDTLGVLRTLDAQNIGNGNYSVRVDTIGMTSPIGVYTFWAGVQDYRPGMESPKEITSDVVLVKVLNNNPIFNIASNLIINGLNPDNESISVRIGNPINLTVSASDPEGTVRFILIKLIQYGTGIWKNYTLNYLDDPHTIIISSSDLAVGTWAVYITVIDQDGGSVDSPINPPIEILPEPWNIAAPIVFFIIGLIVGIAIGAPLLSWRARQKATRKALETPTKVEEVPPVVDKAKKTPAQPERKEEEENEDETPEDEEPESEGKTQMKRKIRRRLN